MANAGLLAGSASVKGLGDDTGVDLYIAVGAIFKSFGPSQQKY